MRQNHLKKHFYVHLENTDISIYENIKYLRDYDYSFLNYNQTSKIDWGEIVNLRVNNQCQKTSNTYEKCSFSVFNIF